MPQINLHNIDCMEFMKNCPDKAYDLAIVDPPYGIGESSRNVVSRHHSQAKYKRSDWDKEPPPVEYFNELFRVSKNQIIWGANHFINRMPVNSSCWIYWHKDRFGDFADGELAWTSFPTAVRMFKYTWDGFRKQSPQDRIHPTEKPFGLYRWLLKNYANEGDKILDTHGGSMSIAVACYDMGFDIDICELDKGYFIDGQKRLDDHIAKYEPAEKVPATKTGQVKLF